MDYKKAIEELENHIQNISVRDCELLDAIDFAIGIMMEVDSTEKVMPTEYCNSCEDDRDGWFNREVDQYIVTHSKKMIEMNVEITELKKEIAAHVAAQKELRKVVERKDNEIDELKEEIAHWKNSYDHMQASFNVTYTDMVSSKKLVTVMRNEIAELKRKDTIHWKTRKGLVNKIAELKEKLSGFKAARIAYASEFESDTDGNPDVGSIHQNICELKEKLKKYEGGE